MRPPPPPIAETTETQSPRTFLSNFSIHSGKTGRIGRRLSSRTSEPSTFYREATPPSSSQGEPVARPEETYDGRYDYVAPPAPLPAAPTKFGISRRRFCILLWAIIVVIVIIAVAVPVGVVFGMRSSRHDTTADNKVASVTRYGITLRKLCSFFLHNSNVLCSTTSPTSSTTSTTTATSTAPSAASTSLMPCPAANNTRYLEPSSEKTFTRLCGIDFSGVDQARDLGSVWTTTMQDCIFQCADFPGCTACGWGIIADDPGSEHRCWLKADLKSSHNARTGWDFAILEQ